MLLLSTFVFAVIAANAQKLSQKEVLDTGFSIIFSIIVSMSWKMYSREDRVMGLLSWNKGAGE